MAAYNSIKQRQYEELLISNIICDKCNKKIEKYFIENTFIDMATHIIVQCHGEGEKMILDQEFLEKFKYNIQPGKAFVDKKLLSEKLK